MGILKAIGILLLSLTIVQCSSKPTDESIENYTRYEDYNDGQRSTAELDTREDASTEYKAELDTREPASTEYKAELDTRDAASTDYNDDDYGSPNSSIEEEQNEFVDKQIEGNNEEPEVYGDMGEEKLPVAAAMQEEEEVVYEAPKKRVSSKFKNGMYRASKDCNMRKRATSKSKKVGTVKRGKKLWMERHNSKWVKIFKKSGPVYISKSCL